MLSIKSSRYLLIHEGWWCWEPQNQRLFSNIRRSATYVLKNYHWHHHKSRTAMKFFSTGFLLLVSFLSLFFFIYRPPPPPLESAKFLSHIPTYTRRLYSFKARFFIFFQPSVIEKLTKKNSHQTSLIIL